MHRVPQDRAQECVRKLREEGHKEAAVVGNLLDEEQTKGLAAAHCIVME